MPNSGMTRTPFVIYPPMCPLFAAQLIIIYDRNFGVRDHWTLPICDTIRLGPCDLARHHAELDMDLKYRHYPDRLSELGDAWNEEPNRMR